MDWPGASAETKKQDTRACSQTDEIDSAIKFEDTYPVSAGLVLDPKLPAQAEAVRIFDNIVERASREMMRNWFSHSH
jgi:hypothetical protein